MALVTSSFTMSASGIPMSVEIMSGSASTTSRHGRSGLLDAAVICLTKHNDETVKHYGSRIIVFVKLLVNGCDGRDAR